MDIDLVKSVFSGSLKNLENTVEDITLKSAIEVVVNEAIEEFSLKSIVEEAVEEVLAEMLEEQDE